MKNTNRFIPAVATVLSLAISPVAFTQGVGEARDPRPAGEGLTETQKPEATMAGQHKPHKTNKASELIGMSVRNPQDEELGTIKDIVIDFEQGRVAYVVLATGGLLGLGEKLVAVPINILRGQGDEADYLTLNASKAKLDAAKGFDPDNYPAMQPSAWGAESFWNPEGTETPDRFPAGERQPDLDRSPGQPGQGDPQPQSPPNQQSPER